MATFRSFWYKGPLSPYEKLCLKSFVSKGHDFTLYSYEKIYDLPKGVKLEDASSVFSEEDVFFYRRGVGSGSVSAFSNLFRYKLLNQFGDWWADTDVICLSKDLPTGEICFGYEEENYINGALLKIPVRHDFSSALLRGAYALGRDFVWGECGPKLITRVVEEFDLTHLAVPINAFYPLNHRRALDVLVPDLRDEVHAATQGSYFLHLWNEMLRRAPILKNVAPPRGSYLWEQFVELGIEFGKCGQYSGYQIQQIVASKKLAVALNERDKQIAKLRQLLAERDEENARIRELLQERTEQLAKLSR